MNTQNEFSQAVREARARLLQMHYKSGVGHIGGNLSCLDALMVLHHQTLTPDDRFVLSKGHSAGALYIALWSLGRIADHELDTFHKDGTRLSGHPSPNHLPDIPFATGSLGHGLSLASGLALAKQIKGDAGRVYCLTSDGEWQEGSTWEALIFAAHRRLPLTLLVDANGLQGFGTTAQVAGMASLTAKLTAFGIPVTEIDGHDLDALTVSLSLAWDGVQALVLRTRKGRGVSFMEGQMDWHYRPLSEAQYEQALQEVWGAA